MTIPTKTASMIIPTSMIISTRAASALAQSSIQLGPLKEELRLLAFQSPSVGHRHLTVFSDGDVMAMLVVVLMELSESNRADIKAMLEEMQSARVAHEKLRAMIEGIKKLVDEQKALLLRIQLVHDKIIQAKKRLRLLLASPELPSARSPDFTDGDVMTMALLLAREEYLSDQAEKSLAERIRRLMLEKKDVGLRVQRVCDQINQALAARRARRHWP